MVKGAKGASECFDTSKSCVGCVFWKGRTDLNKCRLHPSTLPDWAVGCDDFKRRLVDGKSNQDS